MKATILLLLLLFMATMFLLNDREHRQNILELKEQCIDKVKYANMDKELFNTVFPLAEYYDSTKELV